MNYNETMELLIQLLHASEKCLDTGNVLTARIWHDLFVKGWRAHFTEGVGVTSIPAYNVHRRYQELRKRLFEELDCATVKKEADANQIGTKQNAGTSLRSSL